MDQLMSVYRNMYEIPMQSLSEKQQICLLFPMPIFYVSLMSFVWFW